MPCDNLVEALDDNPFAGHQTALDDGVVAHLGPGLDETLLDDAVGPHDVDVSPAVLDDQRLGGHDDGVFAHVH